MHAWKAYIKMLEPEIGVVTYASWRNKFEYGWHESWIMGMDGKKTSKPVDWQESYNFILREKKTFVQSRKSQGDVFYKLFLGDVSLGPQCEKNCKYKYDRSSADIRIGDLWGNTYKDDEKGVSALVAFTEKGRKVVERLKNVTLVEHPFDVVAEGQMKKNAHAKEVKPFVMWALKKGIPLGGFYYKTLFFLQKVISRLKRYI